MEKRSLSKPKRETTTLNENRQKSFTEQQYKQPAARESTSSTKDLKIKQGGDRASKSRDRNLQVRQALSQRSGDHGVSKTGERPSKVVQHWRPKQGDHGASNPGERPFNAGKEVPSLEGGGVGDKWLKKIIKGYGGVQLTNNSPG